MREEWLIDGEQLPVEQVDRFDGDLIASAGVTTAVEHGFDFANIWRHNEVEVEKDDGTFTATVVACEIEHGMAAIRLTDMESESTTES